MKKIITTPGFKIVSKNYFKRMEYPQTVIGKYSKPMDKFNFSNLETQLLIFNYEVLLLNKLNKVTSFINLINVVYVF